MEKVKRFLVAALALSIAQPIASARASAQLPRACMISDSLSMAKLRTCIDSLEARRRSDSARAEARLQTLESAIAHGISRIPPSPGSGSGGAPSVGGGQVYEYPPGALQLRANTGHLVSQGDITDEYCGQIMINGWDGGLRLSQNMKDNNWTSPCTTHLPAVTWGSDSHGAWSYGWIPAADGSSGDRWPLDAATAPFYVGQTLIVDGGSQLPYAYMTETPLMQKRYAMIASQRKGWPLYLAVAPGRANGAPENYGVVKLNADGSPNPVELVIDGSLRRLKSCNVGGQIVVCF